MTIPVGLQPAMFATGAAHGLCPPTVPRVIGAALTVRHSDVLTYIQVTAIGAAQGLGRRRIAEDYASSSQSPGAHPGKEFPARGLSACLSKPWSSRVCTLTIDNHYRTSSAEAASFSAAASASDCAEVMVKAVRGSPSLKRTADGLTSMPSSSLLH